MSSALVTSCCLHPLLPGRSAPVASILFCLAGAASLRTVGEGIQREFSLLGKGLPRPRSPARCTLLHAAQAALTGQWRHASTHGAPTPASCPCARICLPLRYLPIGASEAETAELRQSLLEDASTKEGGPRGGGGGGGGGGRRSSGRFAGRGKHRRMADLEGAPREESEAGIDGVGGSSESTGVVALLSPHTPSHPLSQAPAREDRR